MKFRKIDSAIENCQNYLNENGGYGTEIEMYITRYLLIHICAVFETEIKKIVVVNAKPKCNPFICSYVESSLKNTFRQIDTKGISTLLALFGATYKTKFQKTLNEGNTVIKDSYNSIVNNRHNTAHGNEANVTLIELVNYYEEGHKVLDVLHNIMSGNPS